MKEDGQSSGDDLILRRLGARLREERAEEELPPGVPPFDEAAVDRIAARLLADDRDKGLPPRASEGKVIRPARFWWAAGPVAAAAAVVLWASTRGPGDAMPSYDLSVVGAKASRATPGPERTVTTAEVLLDPSGDFELVARPAAPTPNVGARAVLVREGAARPWAALIDVSSEGAIRITGTTRSLFPETRGSYEIVVLIARSGALPSDAEATRMATSTTPSSLREVRARVRFVEP